MPQGGGHRGAETQTISMRGCTWIWHDAAVREAIDSLLLQGATFDETSAYIREHCPHLGQPSADTIRRYMAFKMEWIRQLLLRDDSQPPENAHQIPATAPSPAALLRQLITSVAPSWAYVRQGRQAESCSICSQSLRKGAVVRRLKCGHIFHAQCIDEWLKKSFTCGYCRQTLL